MPAQGGGCGYQSCRTQRNPPACDRLIRKARVPPLLQGNNLALGRKKSPIILLPRVRGHCCGFPMSRPRDRGTLPNNCPRERECGREVRRIKTRGISKRGLGRVGWRGVGGAVVSTHGPGDTLWLNLVDDAYSYRKVIMEH